MDCQKFMYCLENWSIVGQNLKIWLKELNSFPPKSVWVVFLESLISFELFKGSFQSKPPLSVADIICEQPLPQIYFILSFSGEIAGWICFSIPVMKHIHICAVQPVNFHHRHVLASPTLELAHSKHLEILALRQDFGPQRILPLFVHKSRQTFSEGNLKTKWSYSRTASPQQMG